MGLGSGQDGFNSGGRPGHINHTLPSGTRRGIEHHARHNRYRRAQIIMGYRRYRDGMGWDRMGRDGVGDGMGWGGVGRDGTGQDGTGRYRTRQDGTDSMHLST